MSRESASVAFLSKLPERFVEQWRCLAVSSATLMARTWGRLLCMKRSSALSLPGGLVPLSPAGCVSIHQCTKILLIARSFRLYTGLTDPGSGEPVFLDDQTVDELCQSNISFLDGLASIAPVAAVVQRDVRDMVAVHKRVTPVYLTTRDLAPVTSDVQREKVLSRYHTLAMGIAASSQSGASETPYSHDAASSQLGIESQGSRHLNHVLNPPMVPWTFPRVAGATQLSELSQRRAEKEQEHYSHHQYDEQRQIQDQQEDMGGTYSESHNIIRGFGGAYWEGSTPDALIAEYFVPASRYDIDGELDQFLMNISTQDQ